MDDVAKALDRLHTEIIDARNGYAEAMRLADTDDMRAIFRDLHDLHATHADALAAALASRGAAADEDGSILTTVHKAVLNLRALFGGLDESALAGVADGEERLLDLYDETLEATAEDPDASKLILGQITELNARLAAIETRAA